MVFLKKQPYNNYIPLVDAIYFIKMESNTAKLKAEAEARILQEMDEEHALHNEVQGKKRQYLLMEKERTINEMLDLQVSNPLACSKILYNIILELF